MKLWGQYAVVGANVYTEVRTMFTDDNGRAYAERLRYVVSLTLKDDAGRIETDNGLHFGNEALAYRTAHDFMATYA